MMDRRLLLIWLRNRIIADEKTVRGTSNVNGVMREFDMIFTACSLFLILELGIIPLTRLGTLFVCQGTSISLL